MPRVRFSLVDIVTLILALAMLLAVGVPVVANARSGGNALGCASNLKHIGLAILLYSNGNRGAYPCTRADADPTWWTAYSHPFAPEPFADDGPVANDVTAALFLLLRTQDITPDVFVCPFTTRITAWDYGGASRTARNCSNFPSGRHLGYSYVNPYANEAAKKAGYRLNNSISAEVAVAADMNPGGVDLLQLTASSPSKAMKRGNSRNHYQARGQSVLFGDGHVELTQTPFIGVQRDNIYTFGKSGATSGGDGIVGSPVDPNDSVLLPVASFDPGSSPNAPGERTDWPKYVGSGVIGAVGITFGLMLWRQSRRKPVVA
jgi:hypothetical protein